MYLREDADPEADLLPPPPRPHSAWPPLRSAPPPPPPALAPTRPPPRSPVLHLLLPPQAILHPKMRCKEVSNFILEKWYENEKVTSSL
jgi:hypothetical protein